MSRQELGATQNAPIAGIRLPEKENDLQGGEDNSEENFDAYDYKPISGCTVESSGNTMPPGTVHSSPTAGIRLPSEATDLPEARVISAENFDAYNYQPTMGYAVETTGSTGPPSTVFSPRTAADRSTTIATESSQVLTATSESGIAPSYGDAEANPGPEPEEAYDPPESSNSGTAAEAPAPSTLKRKTILATGWAVVLLFVAAAIVGGVCGSGKCSRVDSLRVNGTTSSHVDNATAPGMTLWSSRTLSSIEERGTLNCGIADTNLVGQTIGAGTNLTGFSVDLCKALAAAIFGSATGHVNYTIVTPIDRFAALNNGFVDVLASSTTHTMEREIYEPTTLKGYSFSTPYLYSGLKFGGLPLYRTCVDGLLTTDDTNTTNTTNTSDLTNTTNSPNITGVNCSGMVVCVLDTSTYEPIVIKLLPGATPVKAVDLDAFYGNFRQGLCNVLAGDEFETAKETVESAGYVETYEVGDNFYSKEPLALVTRQDDGAWSDFVNWVIIGLLSAEEQNITQSRANAFPHKVTAFGDRFKNMFSSAVAEVGHYGEIYYRNLEATVPRVPRSPVNQIRQKNETSGLLYPMPFGATDKQGTEPVLGSTLRNITERGFLRCGIAQRPIFGVLNESTGIWSGFDVDFCRALSAAIFNGVTSTTIKFIEVSLSDRFVALARGDVDVLSRVTTITLERDVLERDAKVGFSFSQPAFYDGVQFGGKPLYLECAESLYTGGQCAGLRICVSNSTTSIATVRLLFPPRFIVATASSDMTAQGLVMDLCNAIGGGVVDVSTTNINDFGFYNGLYKHGSRRFSKDPLALVTRQDDPQWSAFVFWIVSAIFYAEEIGATSATASSNQTIPTVNLFGELYGNMFRDAIAAVGSYAEIYARNAETESPRSGLNTLNTNPLRAQHYPLPGVGSDIISYQA